MIRILDTLTDKRKTLKARPFAKGRVKLFVCGPTVYDYSHIGHARTYIAFDFIAKYLRFRGFSNLYYLQNITDIDDKIIERAKQEKTTPIELAGQFTKAYHKDMQTLGITSVTKYAPASQFIPEIIKQVQRLIQKGYAYEAGGDVFFDITKFPGYGKLSKQKINSLRGEREVYGREKKKHTFDFTLWKKQKFSYEPSWSSPWGQGRPGWHIEDTAITEKFFGPQYDLHGGARDLIFPHHESEIAQMEALSGKQPLVQIWMHTGFLNVAGEKMSKSLGNFITIRDFLKQYPPGLLRFLVLLRHYRSPLNYTPSLLRQAEKTLNRLTLFTSSLARKPQPAKRHIDVRNLIQLLQKTFFKHLDDDFDTPKAFASLFSFVRKNQERVFHFSPISRKLLLKFLRDIESFLGFGLFHGLEIKLPKKISQLANKREELRREKKWKEADSIRNKILRLGWHVEDTPQGPRLKPVRSLLSQ